MSKRIIYDVKTGKKQEVNEDRIEINKPADIDENLKVDLRDLKKIVNYAKKQGWI